MSICVLRTQYAYTLSLFLSVTLPCIRANRPHTEGKEVNEANISDTQREIIAQITVAMPGQANWENKKKDCMACVTKIEYTWV